MSDTAQPSASPASQAFCPPAQRIYVLVAAILASSMGFIDGSVLSIATPAIRADLGASLADAQWISNAYLLFLASLLLIGGAAGDRFGLRRVFGLGIALFVAASLVCAVAPNPVFLILARELTIAGWRVSGQTVPGAAMWGKVKTVVQIIAIAVLIAPLGESFDGLGTGLFWVAVALTWVSGALYLWPQSKA